MLLAVLERGTPCRGLEYPPEMRNALKSRLRRHPGDRPLRLREQYLSLTDSDIVQVLNDGEACRLLENPAQIRSADEEPLGNPPRLSRSL